MRITKLWFLLIAAVALALVMAGCTKEGDPVKGNIAPDTRILSYVVSSAAELDTLGQPSNNYAVTVYWAGSDLDGRIISYLFSVGSISDSLSFNNQEDIVLDFENAASQYLLSVQAIDNEGEPDPTPAQIIIQRNAGGVETAIRNGPPHGAEVSAGVDYEVGATSPTGTITHIEYSVNGGPWTQVAANDQGIAFIQITDMDAGLNIIAFAGVRDDGVKDESPATISLMVRSGLFKPLLQNLSPVVDGGGWFKGVDLTISWRTEQAHYYGGLPEGAAYCYAVGQDLDPPDGYDTDPDASFGSGWIGDEFAVYAPEAGNHAFYLKVRDYAGAVDTMRIRFSAAEATLDHGILIVNGVHPPTYSTEALPKFEAGAYWGGRDVSFWDLFGSMDDPHADVTLPVNVTYVGGGAALAPTVIGQYSTVVWLANEYQGDEVYWHQTPILPYLQAGGNVIFGSRYATDLVSGALADYLGFYFVAGGATATEYLPIFPGLVAMGPPWTRALSATDYFWVDNVMNDADNNAVDNWDGTSSFTTGSLTETLLFVHRLGLNADWVVGLGVWAHPNFAFSSTSAGDEFPTPGTSEAQGNFILLNGRHYAWVLESVNTNFDFMLTNMCGEQ